MHLVLFGDVFCEILSTNLKNGHSDWWKIILVKQAILIMKIVKFMLILKL